MPRRARIAFLALGFVSLIAGVAGGLARLATISVPPMAVAFHGALMVSAFFGTLISLERAVALGRTWAYAAPLCAGAGGVFLLLGMPYEGFAAMTLAAATLAVVSLFLVRRQPSLEMTLLLAGAVSWMVGNTAAFFGLPAVPWWISFFALTIAAERLELSRYLRRPRLARPAFIAIAAALLAAPLAPRVLGVVLALLAAWLFAYDLARVTVRQSKLPRYAAVCLLAGYFWLAVGGALLAVAAPDDAALHAFFLGFVFSMVFGHAPIILPAILGVAFPYRPVLYLPLVLLHGSVALRVWNPALGAWGNAAAIGVFIMTALALVIVVDRRQGTGAALR
jgi:hypothetical protein